MWNGEYNSGYYPNGNGNGNGNGAYMALWIIIIILIVVAIWWCCCGKSNFYQGASEMGVWTGPMSYGPGRGMIDGGNGQSALGQLDSVLLKNNY